MSQTPDQTTAWVAVDWGTTHMRLWRMATDGTVLGCQSCNKGMGQIEPHAYEGILLDMLADHLPPSAALDVVVCGMAGSRQGWAEAPYAPTPCAPPSIEQATLVPTDDPRLRVHILPGVKQVDPIDVMRGEETQIRGVTARMPDYDGVICLPGTHTKWVRIKQGQIGEFATFMSGELFTVIGQHSVLRHSVGTSGWDRDAFRTACQGATDDATFLMRSLFGLRAGSLLADLSPEAARATLSGLLLGAELAAARSFWGDRDVTIVGESTLSQAYGDALALQGMTPQMMDDEETTLNGLRDAYAQLLES
ncbi:2-dehydro-3-deoxygalactonokinase [Epibacterium ulvae]|uniref:2-dehydro-3-deoxygalactonokinase n=1 Tax=Epibacterium ulvae TaxID=1156985 RepID=UPI001BFBF7F0|nr:2-dehydro-3-deoxygalactonokinase [Epibacterium ulvae]MBT8154957.1 2-dehydro-3-deoxygalactonokinase [Epibacterium ulvae]